jgi:hypothetical protein
VKKTKIESKNTLSFWKPVLLSIVITPLFLLIALGSGGVGHGTYGAVLLIFPFASLSAVVLDRFFDATLVMILMAVLQFPAYGVVVGICARKDLVSVVMVGIVAVHIVFSLLAFWAAR